MKTTFIMGKWLSILIKTMVVLAVIYHLSSVYLSFHSQIEYLNAHLFFALMIAGLDSLRRWPKYWPLWLLFIAGSLIGTGYVQFNYRVLEMRGGFPITADMYMGVLLTVVTIIGSWWAYGTCIPIMVLIFIAYALLGFLLPGIFHIPPPEFPRLISQTSIGLKGLYGTPLAASAHYVFFFIMFGGLLQVSKASDMFSEFGKLISRGTRGGPAHACVVTSGLVGMISGSAAGNAALSGSITIPMMKRGGFKPVQAAAFEAAASQGGQIMPPVMGASAFVMAELTGVPYVDLAMIAFLPAFLFFLSIAVAAEMRGRQLRLAPSKEMIDFRKLFIGLPLFLVPIVILVVFFLLDFSANYAAFWAIIGLLATACIRKEMRISWNKLLEGLEMGVIGGVQVALACASLGIVVQIMIATDLSLTIPKIVEMASMGNLWIAMFLVMIVSIILGGPLPTLPTYLMTVLVTAPVMVSLGVPLLAAHLAVFYFAIFEGVTPPFGGTALITCQIAQADLMETCWEGCRVCLPGLLLPFFWVINPALLDIFSHPLATLITIAGIIAQMISINIFFTNFYFIDLKRWERMVGLLSSISLGIPLALGNDLMIIIGSLPFIFLTIWQFRANKEALEREPRMA